LSTYHGSPDWRLFGDGLRVQKDPFLYFVVVDITWQTKNARLFFVLPAAAMRVVFCFSSRDSPLFPRFLHDGGGGGCGRRLFIDIMFIFLFVEAAGAATPFFPLQIRKPLAFFYFDGSATAADSPKKAGIRGERRDIHSRPPKNNIKIFGFTY